MPQPLFQPSGSRRHSRRQSALRRRRTIVLAVVASAALVAATWIGVASVRKAPIDSSPTLTAEQDEWLNQALVDSMSGSNAPTKATGRAVYKYSVIPGGAHDRDELQRAMADPAVAAHYKKVDPANIRVETVPADRYVHVSYRKGDTILWSKKKVLLRKGEKILTDGTTQIRTRCGNCISDEPLAPTAADEPDVVEFDRLVDSFDPLATAPETVSANMAADPTSAGLAGAAGGPSAVPLAGGAAPLGGGAAGGSGVPLVGATRSGHREPGDPSDPFAGNPEGSAFVELLTPGGNGVPTLDELFPPGPNQPNGPDGPTSENPPIPTDNDPVNPVPVPEPGTFMLLGGGVAALIRRRLRSRHD